MIETKPEAVILASGRYLRLIARDGWEYAERCNARCAVIIVAVTPDDHLLLVEQFRVPLGAPTIEMPAGLVGDIDTGEAIESAAIRELIEETGWRAERIEWLMQGPSSAGMSNEVIAFVRARGLCKVGVGGGVAGENIIVHEVARQNAATWLVEKAAQGYAIDPKLYAGLYFIDSNADGSRANQG